MISVILSILKFILILLACIIGLIIFILGLILFVPIRYEARGSFYDNISAKGRISWLLRIFSIRIIYDDEDFNVKFSIFGIAINPSAKDKAKGTHSSDLPSKKSGKKKAVTKPSKLAEKNNQSQDNYNKSRDSKNKKLIDTNDKVRGLKEKTTSEKDRHLLDSKDKTKTISTKGQIDSKHKTSLDIEEKHGDKKDSVFSKILDKLKLIKEFILKVFKIIISILVNIYKFLLQIEDEESKESKFSKIRVFLKNNKLGVKVIIKAVKDLVNHIRPRKFKGDIEFGSEDPAVTGQILGLASIFYGLYYKSIRIVPNFEEKILKGQVYLRGRIRLFSVAIIVIKLVSNKNFRSLWNEYNVLKEEL